VQGSEGVRTMMLNILILLAILFTGCRQPEKEIPDSQLVLTEQHGAEIAQTIEIAHSRLGSMEVHNNPSALSDILTGPYLNVYAPLIADNSQTENPILISSVNVYGIRVFEYSSENFTAVGCGTYYADQVTSTGEFIKSMPTYDFRTLYMFVKEEDVWKIALEVGLNSAYDDWVYAADWERELVGDIELYMDADCLDVP
jgi:starvation-inducible outer membrane lipoprotein